MDANGIVDMGGRSALVLTCTSVPFHLFSGEEQDQALAVFAGFLDVLNAPTQILIQRHRMDLTPHMDRLRSGIGDLPVPLQRAARSHAAFLDDLQHNYDLIHHQVLLVLTAPGFADTAADALPETWGCQRLYLTSEPDNQAAHASWTALGFVNVPGDHEINGVSVTSDFKGPGCYRAVYQLLLG